MQTLIISTRNNIDLMKRSSAIFQLLVLMIALPAKAELTHKLFINEVMQSVVSGEFDQLGEYPDSWVELYNPSDQSVTLTGCYIGKKYNTSKCYKIPQKTKLRETSYGWFSYSEWVSDGNIVVPAKGYRVIYCDLENVVMGNEVHTDFRLSNAKEGTVYLFDSNKNLIDSLFVPSMPAMNVSYGRETDGSSRLGYMLNSSKGKSNTGGFASMVLPSPLFSSESRVFEAAAGDGNGIELSISMPVGLPSDAVIRYTTDGTEPIQSGKTYTSPLRISANTIVKAAIFAEGCVTPPAATRSFIFHGRALKLPIFSLVASESDLYDKNKGIIAVNKSSDEKENWRRPMVMDYFPAGESVSSFNQTCEARIGGAYSRANKQKTFIVYANSRFGSKDYFEARFWPHTNPDMLRSPSISLRNSGNDFNYSQLRDGVVQTLFGLGTDNLDWQGFQPAVVYINGKYYGILNIRERANEDNVWMHHDGMEDITLVENPDWGSDGLKVGDWNQYQEFSNFLNTNNIYLFNYEARMDVEEFTNMMIANIYMSNTDFPGNNHVMWRPSESGGKWRWILKDVDRSFGYCYYHGDSSNRDGGRATAQYLKWILRNPANVFSNNYEGNPEGATRLIRNLMKISAYSSAFIDRFTVYLGDFLRPDHIASVIDWAADQMRDEMPYHKALYGGKASDWETELRNMKSWSVSRTASMYSQLKDYFKLGTPVPVTVTQDLPASWKIAINGIPLSTSVFDGKMYSSRKYTIQVSTEDGTPEDLGWRVIRVSSTGSETEEIVFSPTVEISPNGESSISVELLDGVSGIERSLYLADPVSVTYYNMQGVPSHVPYQGVNIIRSTYPDGTVSVDKRAYVE